MPTARELLEQADALMRRNRGVEVPRSQPLGPQTITYGPTISPRSIQREPIAPSIVDAPSPEDAEQPAPAALREADDGDVPLLTDAIGEVAVDDVPLLTDAVEEIDVTVVDEAVQGDPSHWELTTGETSVRPALDSIAVAPAPSAAKAGQDVEEVATSGGDANGLGRAEELLEVPPVPAVLEAEEDRGEVVPADPLGLDQPVPAFEASGEPEALRGENTTARDAHETAQVRAIAEEIGMQVLQRIDIFSDTELRSQLRERMKPTVDRVSAELAAEINQHVGELVRVYIAEAIDREIESWRKGGQ